MPVGATLGAAGIGAATSIYGSSRAAGMQKRAAQQAQQTMRPYTETGAGAIQSLAQLYGIPTSQNPNPGMPFNEASMNAFRNSPDYAFAENEGRRQLMFGQAKLGGLNSGNTGRDLVSFGQGLATQNFGNYFSRLQQLAQIGQGGANSTASAQMAQGQAGASGVVGATNAINQGLGDVSKYFQLQSLLGKPSGGSVYGGQMGPQVPGGFTPAGAGELPWLGGGVSSGGYGAMPSSSSFGMLPTS